MPEFPRNVDEFALKVAFHHPFESLLVSMFLRENGFTGYEEDNVKTQPGHWYGISWPCIDRDIPYFWRPMARTIRENFYYRIWRKFRTLGNEKIFKSGGERALTFIAMFNAVPRISFSRAAQQLIESGYLEHRVEQDVHMYYPLPALADRIWEAQR